MRGERSQRLRKYRQVGRRRSLFVPGAGSTRDKRLPFVPGGGSTRDKKATRSFVSVGATTRNKKLLFLSRLVPTTGIKNLYLLAGPASRWTRDKNHLLSRAQRQPGQMVWNKDLLCSSDSNQDYMILIRWWDILTVQP